MRTPGRSIGPGSGVYKRPSADSKEAIMLRARQKRVDAQFLEKNYSGGMGRNTVGEDRVSNPRPRKPR